MIAIAGVLLIITAFYVGVPGKIYLDGITTGQALLFLGVALLTWALLNAFKKYVDHVPLLIGFAVIGFFGIYGRDVLGIAGGVAIITVWGWNRWRSGNSKKR